jgi:hypothetical protein
VPYPARRYRKVTLADDIGQGSVAPGAAEPALMYWTASSTVEIPPTPTTGMPTRARARQTE